MGAGWSDSNNIYIWVNKPTYAPGEQVNGEVFVNVVEAIQAGRLVLYLDGEEDVSYTDSRMSLSTYVAEKKVYYSEAHALLLLEDGKLAAGKYRFPFCFTLPSKIAPNCSVAGLAGAPQAQYAGHVTYKLRCQMEENVSTPPREAGSSSPVARAALDAPGQASNAASYAADDFEVVEVSGETPEQLAELMNAAPLNGFLRNKLSKSAGATAVGGLSQEIELSIEVRREKPEVTEREFVEYFQLLRCIPLGSLRTSVAADSLACYPGEGVTVTVDIANRTKRKIQEIVVSLVREVIFSVDGRDKFTMREVVASEKIPGPPREKDFKGFGPQKIKIAVPTGSQPTMTSALLRLQYKVQTSFQLGRKPFSFSLDLEVLKKSPSVKEHLINFRAPKGWDKVPLLPQTDLAMIQLPGAPAPDRGEYTGIGMIIC
ncbi:conserved hypothetical protein [Neospora caninum Liverpool]|uniref:Arrestin (Or s-antigen), n-terminal domain-containing protein n=1 Tax=Neospora caninum (strain Liverpool) TaxID=572307 RepID=F0VPJ2_NEOCL|nr:conserved hypothetical protein [Neospora caninum Liverpool]CBZ55638.1 conserved hypothetical protein [Neospora caninum Liverpool]CEL70380.1 TPA: arrestin (or s-antigen), n-terminal domain-containing protein [Neospora caninum Liverpool]|eukprot:XP_003885666.1 conserved hypothetical protein [Neospora caninum Liverpool]